MTAEERSPTGDDGVLADIRGLADDGGTPPATRLRALELLAKLAGMFRERRETRPVSIVRLTPPLRLPPNGEEQEDDGNADADGA